MKEGANLAASASVKDFPLLVRLHRNHFNFSEAEADGSDIRFSSGGKPLPFEIEAWNREAGTAGIWVRIPSIKGNDRQEIRIHWGKARVPNASDGKAVFNASNGYIGVWHLGHEVRDVVGNLKSEDKGTTQTAGMIGSARHLSERTGIFCGTDIQKLPLGGAPHSTQAWFRSEKSNGRIVCWGNEKRAGKVTMIYRSPPRIRMDCYFSNGDVRAEIPDRAKGWTHVFHTYRNDHSILYINGEKRGEGNPRHWKLAIERPARMWIGGWYNRFDYAGDIDEVRISGVARSSDWVRLDYENQKPMQTLVGPVVQDGDEFAVSPNRVTMNEADTIELTARAKGAQKMYWILEQNDAKKVVAVDRLSYRLDAGRVNGNSSRVVQFKAVYPDEVKVKYIPVTIKELIPEPVFTLKAPSKWNGRDTIEVAPVISNLKAMTKKGAGKLAYKWNVSGGAVLKKVVPGRLILERSQCSGRITVALALNNGGSDVSANTSIDITEPDHDPWVRRVPGKDERPQDFQFYARDDQNQGTLHYNGALEQAADSVFLRVYADDRLYKTEAQTLNADRRYAFAVKLKPGLIRYRVEFGSKIAGVERLLHKAGDLLCGDAYLIDGQSNALATDTREKSPLETNDWIRSYARPRHYRKDKPRNLWCNPVWKAGREHKAELGWWGMVLAKRLLKSRKVPIFIINGAVGGTRIDQHQRSKTDPVDLKTIYGRMLWRVRQAKLTHGIRAVLWHQGENDQGAAGPDGDYGWKTYQQYFVDMSAAWKQDFPNVQHYYIFQIWPNSCSMGNGNGNMLREVQRTLPRLYSNMDIMSTLGIKPPGPAHFPLTGWAEFARLIQPLIERDIYGKPPAGYITPPNLKQARYENNAITLEFDQPVVWTNSLIDQFYLDGAKGKVASGSAAGNVVTLKLKAASAAKKITYLNEMSWTQKKLLIGKNGIAALT
ncbi:MAG: DUF2341 domain-containing protein, partial [Planctomycetota bacterium]|nr:DUF2341 domain-containing protein [Planctomycetota bacterium]